MTVLSDNIQIEAESVHVFGIRHHGPGSARSLLRSLQMLQPDIVLIEGPPEANSLIHLASLPTMCPPVAILIYAPEEPNRAVFYPFASFSPEWIAMQYANEQGIPAQFIDLPQTNQFAMRMDEADTGQEQLEEAPDPFGFLSEAAGYTDTERWWENLVEHRRNDLDVFAAITTGTTALRNEINAELSYVEACREAYMRQTIRRAVRDGYTKLAVVCGAWHAPALTSMPTEKSDNALLHGLSQKKVTATWTPWTNSRLSYQSGYGAGIESPGWYGHLWSCDGNVTINWMTKIARLLRDRDLAGSPASIIDAVRLAETLASLRGLSIPSLREMNEAAVSVFSFGKHVGLKLIEEQLIIGVEIGAIPLETPMAPLQADITRQQKKLRLQPEVVDKTIDLDLRKESDLAKSHLLHRLGILNIPWGIAQANHGAKGTFHELWHLRWRPEFAINIIEAGLWGNTVFRAVQASIQASANSARDVCVISNLLNSVILADLQESTVLLIQKLDAESVVCPDVGLLMDSLPALSNISRYGNVRKTDSQLIQSVIERLLTRITIALPNSCVSLNDEASELMFIRIKQTHSSISLLQNDTYLTKWMQVVDKLTEIPNVNGLIAGRACRILLDAGIKATKEIAVKLQLALGKATEPISAAQWVEGFLQDSGQLLILDDTLRNVIDEWICGLTPETFLLLLPLVRRTFSTFSAPERKQIGQRIKESHQGEQRGIENDDYQIDVSRGQSALPLVLQLLGIRPNGSTIP